jgi:hypothetical protein
VEPRLHHEASARHHSLAAVLQFGFAVFGHLQNSSAQ